MNFCPKPVEPRGFGSADHVALGGPDLRVPARGPAVHERALRATVHPEYERVFFSPHRNPGDAKSTSAPGCRPRPGTVTLSGAGNASSASNARVRVRERRGRAVGEPVDHHLGRGREFRAGEDHEALVARRLNSPFEPPSTIGFTTLVATSTHPQRLRRFPLGVENQLRAIRAPRETPRGNIGRPS